MAWSTYETSAPLIVSFCVPSCICDPRVISSSLVGQYQFIAAFSTLGVGQIAYGESVVVVSEFHLMRSADPVMRTTAWAIRSRWFHFHCRIDVKPN